MPFPISFVWRLRMLCPRDNDTSQVTGNDKCSRPSGGKGPTYLNAPIMCSVSLPFLLFSFVSFFPPFYARHSIRPVLCLAGQNFTSAMTTHFLGPFNCTSSNKLHTVEAKAKPRIVRCELFPTLPQTTQTLLLHFHCHWTIWRAITLLVAFTFTWHDHLLSERYMNYVPEQNSLKQRQMK